VISSAGRVIGGHYNGRPRSSAAGFTLIEMIVVLTILGFAASFVVPSFTSGLPHWRLRGAARDIVTLLKFARNQSVASIRPLHVVLDRSRNLYWLDSADVPVMADPDRSGKRNIRLYALPDGVSFGEVAGGIFPAEKERVRILFFPRGSSSGGDVQLRDEKGRAYRIHVDSVTGRAGIARSEGYRG
jgi:general secretion pathway protein H